MLLFQESVVAPQAMKKFKDLLDNAQARVNTYLLSFDSLEKGLGTKFVKQKKSDSKKTLNELFSNVKDSLNALAVFIIKNEESGSLNQTQLNYCKAQFEQLLTNFENRAKGSAVAPVGTLLIQIRQKASGDVAKEE